ncbi:MAG TPA: hypothetical protein PK325_01110 [Cyclobacteriaceae bacterium]|nr:hypothetical protein [Cyclobacteriaceae bacterium]HMV08131.1 hypothetical protein [Cyclobacteriaceae bacterium]HMV88345.1 hypothetical protein [Cyclobacteriaceae bacterium]HMX00772.1 hypothetical protein [Cyclobacteriaceae bacterium]HMX49353.1 hypothetical protein [Cyclobacteriaceae bacterium]
MEIPIQFLDLDRLRVLRVIRIDGPDWNSFTGYIHYRRHFTKDYNCKTLDLLDDLIFEGVKQMYKSSTRYIDKDILFKGEYEDYLRIIQGGKMIELTLKLTPQIPHDKIWDLVGREFTEYHLTFPFNLQLLGEDKRLNHVLNFGAVTFPFDSIENIPRILRTFEKGNSAGTEQLPLGTL